MTVTDLTIAQEVLQAKLAQAVKSKKSTKSLREQLAEVERQIEQFTAEAVEVQPAKRGRPRSKSPEFYALRDSLKRGQRGRPTRQQTLGTFKVLGVFPDESYTTHQLEREVQALVAGALYNAR